MAPRHVILYNYSPTSRKYEAYNALVIGSAQREGDKELQLNLVHFRHDDLPAHHALSGVDWADTIDRTLDVPHKSDQGNQSFYYVGDAEDELKKELAAQNTTLDSLRKELRGKDDELKALKPEPVKAPEPVKDEKAENKKKE